MNWYKENRQEWKQIIETVARECNRTELMIEKDTVQSMFLYELSKEEIPFVFKGGTSLSKAYEVIDRFSEDIDLSMNRKPTESEKKSSKIAILKTGKMLGMNINNPGKIKSRYDYNMYVFEYDSLFTDIPMEIIIETSYYQTSYPVNKQQIKSFVGEFCEQNAINLPIQFDAKNIYMNVQSIERTFIDKVFAVCDY